RVRKTPGMLRGAQERPTQRRQRQVGATEAVPREEVMARQAGVDPVERAQQALLVTPGGGRLDTQEASEASRRLRPCQPVERRRPERAAAGPSRDQDGGVLQQ